MHQSALVDIGTGNDQHGQDVTIAARREGKLPSASRGYYHEYTVATPGSSDRGARRTRRAVLHPGSLPQFQARARMTLEDLVKSGNDGVFRFPPPLPSGNDAIAETVIVRVATPNVRDKMAFLKACASALAFPAYFGQNWDAFYDCLTALAQRYAGGLVMVFENLSGFARSDPDEFAAALDAMIDAAEFWRDNRARLLVLVGVDQPVLAPELRELSPR